YVAWITCTTLGALLGPLLGHPEAYGLDMAFPAVFLVMLRGMWRGWRRARPWLVSLAVAGLTYRVVPGAWYGPGRRLRDLTTLRTRPRRWRSVAPSASPMTRSSRACAPTPACPTAWS